MSKILPYCALMTAAAGWGVTTATAKYSVTDLGAYTTLMIEITVACVLLWIPLILRRERRVVPLRYYMALGLLEPILAYGGLNLGLEYTTAADAAMLDGLQSAIVFIIGLIFLKEIPTRWAVAGMLVSTAGCILLTSVHLAIDVGIGNVFVLAGSIGASASVVLVSRLMSDASTLEVTAYQFGFGLLFSLPIALAVWISGTEPFPVSPRPGSLIAAILTGTIGFAAAYLLYNYAVVRVHVTVSGMALAGIPLFGAATAVLWLGETPFALKYFGGCLIVAGMLIFSFNESRLARTEAAESEGDIPLTNLEISAQGVLHE